MAYGPLQHVVRRHWLLLHATRPTPRTDECAASSSRRPFARSRVYPLGPSGSRGATDRETAPKIAPTITEQVLRRPDGQPGCARVEGASFDGTSWRGPGHAID